ncbi:putative acetyltransferase [Arthrobacter russicus]|uniref:Histone acetyltransferase Rv0428c-like SH3 domain-containing protein n=1 Tax=Arthrobacter russicus TaxID=172040 RepID=A0ABU1J8M2_9MICC|nr:hypothetical protein [Arthrobacter russicus]MDR6268763.1 hypothetical protein [Arthrobacter russicus]
MIDHMAGLRPGMRVVLRYRIAGPLPLTDALGELLARQDGEATVLTKRGAVVVRESDIVAAKEVPPAPPARAPRRPPVSDSPPHER